MPARPKPTAIKKLQGTLRKDRTNKNEPTFPQIEDEPPAVLSPVGREEWKRILPMLKAIKVVQATDSVALAAYCEAYSRWVQASEATREQGHVIAAPNGVMQVNPHLGIAERASKEMRAWMTEFGITPAARPRVSATPEKKVLDGWEEF